MQFNLEEQIKELRTHNNRLLQQLENKDKHISTLKLQVSKLKCQIKEITDGGQVQGMEDKTWREIVDDLQESYNRDVYQLEQEHRIARDESKNDQLRDATRNKMT